MADTKEREPKVAGAADPGAAPRGEEPKGADAPAPPAPPRTKEPKAKKPKKAPEAGPRAPEPEGPPPPPAEPAPRARLLDYYEQRVRPKLVQQFGFKNQHEIPKLVKIVLNVGPGGADVRVPRPVHQHRGAAHARLPRVADGQLRRPGQLQHRH